jgi:hypothetical protein
VLAVSNLVLAAASRTLRDRFVDESALEEDDSNHRSPRDVCFRNRIGRFTRASGKVGVNENDGTRRSRGTDGSNPAPSSKESPNCRSLSITRSCSSVGKRTTPELRAQPVAGAPG